MKISFKKEMDNHVKIFYTSIVNCCISSSETTSFKQWKKYTQNIVEADSIRISDFIRVFVVSRDRRSRPI